MKKERLKSRRHLLESIIERNAVTIFFSIYKDSITVKKKSWGKRGRCWSRGWATQPTSSGCWSWYLKSFDSERGWWSTVLFMLLLVVFKEANKCCCFWLMSSIQQWSRWNGDDAICWCHGHCLSFSLQTKSSHTFQLLLICFLWSGTVNCGFQLPTQVLFD